MDSLLTKHLDIWTTALAPKTAGGRGRKANGTISPHGIKKLRELILELAVRGKLVLQDPEDEPASVLLEKIAAEKARLLKEKKIKKQKKLPGISEEEKPFVAPKGWEWVRIQEISSYIQRGKGPKYAEYGKVSVVSQKCIQWAGFDMSKSRLVDDSSLKTYQPERFLKCDDLLWNSTGTGTVGRTNVLEAIEPNTLVADSHVTVIRPLKSSSKFLECYLSAPGIQLRIDPEHEYSLVSGTTKQVELNVGTIQPLLVPLPPLAEQHRIVAKVDELMALCDRLELLQSDSNTTHQTLLTTLLASLTTATGPADFSETWQRIQDHFHTLFTSEDVIDQLKQTILQLAVMGKLVPQNPDDEPASILLEKIAAEKARLLKEKKIKKQKKLPEISEEEKPFTLPVEWEWVRLGFLFESFTNGLYKPAKYYIETGTISLRMYNIQNGKIIFTDLKRVQLSEKEEEMYLLQEGDLLINRVNSKELVGKTALIPNYPEPLAYESMNMRARPVRELIASTYLNLFMMTKMAKNLLLSQAKEAISQASLNQGQISNLTIPVPPLPEQHRIVAKVDELMALCDTLKARLSESQTTQINLANAMIEQAISPEVKQ